jgi:hypothetical protein
MCIEPPEKIFLYDTFLLQLPSTTVVNEQGHSRTMLPRETQFNSFFTLICFIPRFVVPLTPEHVQRPHFFVGKRKMLVYLVAFLGV